jgi:REP element-mobilizing transposase RayT
LEVRVAIAYFITFTTYGTWLHGTDKGLGSVDDDHNRYGSPFVTPDAARVAAEQQRMVDEIYFLDAERREVVRDAIVAVAHDKGWRLWAVHVRSNHVHVVISAEREPGRLMSDLKARASAALTKAGFESSTRRRWTRHGSTRHVFNEDSLAERIDYTLECQGERMACYDGRPDLSKPT